MVFVNLYKSQELMIANAISDLADDVSTSVFDLSVISYEVIHRKSDRAIFQWESKSNSLKALLNRYSQQKFGEIQCIDDIKQKLYSVNRLFYLMLDSEQDISSQQITFSSTQILKSQIIAKMHGMIIDAKKLKQDSDIRIGEIIVFNQYAQMAFSTALIMLISVLCYFIYDSVKSSLTGLTKGIKKIQISKHGNLNFSSGSASLPEIEPLTLAIEAMLKDLDEENKISQKERIDLEKESHRAKLENKAKNQILANISHEIRTPLTVISGYAKLLLEGRIEDRDRSHYLNKIVRSASYVTQLTTDILDLSKIEEGRIEVENIPINLVEHLADTFDMLKNIANAKNLYFRISVATNLPEEIILDPTRLRQILVNIISNAIKFTLEGGVEVKIMYRAPFLDFIVSDTGIGIAADMQDKIFKPFVQAEKSIHRKFGGTGLGLSLARLLSMHLNGNVSLVHSVLGKGSKFKITFNVGKISDSKLITVTEKNIFEFKFEGMEKISEDLTGLRILLVDDNYDIRIIFQMVLSCRGAVIDEADNGATALEMASKNIYDLILMDVQMPIMNGLEAAKELKLRGNKTPLVALTAGVTEDEVKRAKEAGFIACLPKPIDFDHLVSFVVAFKKDEKNKLDFLVDNII